MIEIARKVLQLVPDDRWRLSGIIAAMMVTGVLQTVGIASVMPFLAVVSNPSIVTTNAYLRWGYEAFGFQTPESFVFALGLLFLATMAGSNALNTFTGWSVVRFQWRTHEKLSYRLLKRYLEAPYAYHLNHNSSRLAGTLLTQVTKVTGGLFMPFAQILARGISSTFIIVLLVAIDPLLAIAVGGTIGGFYAVVYAFVRKRQGILGEEVVRAKTERFQIAHEAFGGIKELKVLGREGHFLEKFRVPLARYSLASTRSALVGLAPKFSLETLAYGGVVVVILYLLRTRDSLDQVFPLLAVYAFGANRLIPGVQEMFAALAAIRFHAAAVDEVHGDLYGPGTSTLIRETQEAPGGVPAGHVGFIDRIRFRNVTFQYPGATPPALVDVSLEIPINTTVALVGTTGSGKTTVVDLLLGLFEPTEGSIEVDDLPLDSTNLPAWKKKVGYVPQSIFLCDASIAENVALGIPTGAIDEAAVRASARAAHLDSFVASLRDGYETVVGERGIRLSGGQRQRIGIARALYHNPDVLVMDEATSALDNVTEDVVMQAIHELAQRRTILLIAHRLTTVREADIIYLLEQGRVMARGTYDELVASSPAFRAMARV